jgi:hypothetical protein
LDSIALKIDTYISFCEPEDSEGKSLKESQEGDSIIDTIESYFSNLHNRLYHLCLITLNIENQREMGIINSLTERTDRNSNNIYGFRTEIRNPQKLLYTQIENEEKNRIENWCDNYFNSLKELNDLMKPYIKDNSSINKIWPFKETDDTTIRIRILRWIQQLMNGLGNNR